MVGRPSAMIGGGAGSGARRLPDAPARSGADVVRSPARSQRRAQACSARRRRAASSPRLTPDDDGVSRSDLHGLPGPLDTSRWARPAAPQLRAPGSRWNSAQVREALGDHVVLALEVARHAAGNLTPCGALLLVGGTGGRRLSRDLGSSPPRPPPDDPLRSTATLALDLAPVRSPPHLPPGLRRQSRCRRRSSATVSTPARQELRRSALRPIA